MPETLDDILETTEPERLATGFEFTEGPLWHPDGFYFVDIRRSQFFRIVPGKEPELLREGTGQGNGTTFDLSGNVVMCEMENRRVVRLLDDGGTQVLLDRIDGKRLGRPNDVVCKSDGTLYCTDPSVRVPLEEKEIADSGIYRIAPDGAISLLDYFEYPNGLAFSPDERTLYVANSRYTRYIHAVSLDAGGNMTGRRIFADMSSEETDGVPDGMKVDSAGRVFCTGAGATWVFAPEGYLIGKIRLPEVPANLAFGGPDLRTLFFTARTSVYSLRVKTPGQPHPWYAVRSA